MCNETLKCVRAAVVAAETQNVLHNLSVCVSVTLRIQHANRMRHTVACGLHRSTLLFFFTLSHKGTIFEKSY